MSRSNSFLNSKSVSPRVLWLWTFSTMSSLSAAETVSSWWVEHPVQRVHAVRNMHWLQHLNIHCLSELSGHSLPGHTVIWLSGLLFRGMQPSACVCVCVCVCRRRSGNHRVCAGLQARVVSRHWQPVDSVILVPALHSFAVPLWINFVHLSRCQGAGWV